jgi:hypothetical protein
MRYVVEFGKSNTGLTPVMTTFVTLNNLSPVSPPTLTEISGTGCYYFDYSFPNDASPDIFFQVDGGGSITDSTIRYRSGTLSASDSFLDTRSSTDLSTLSTLASRILGLVHENSILDQTVFDDHNNLVSGRLRLYPSQNDLNQKSNILATYAITAAYIPGSSNILSYQMALTALGA